jgi:hypothetical protein
MSLQRKIEASRRWRARQRGEDVPLRTPKWTKEEEQRLVAAYAANVGNKAGWLLAFSKELGRNKANVVRKAKSLGIATDRNRKGTTRPRSPRKIKKSWWNALSPEEQKRIKSERIKAYQKVHGHPRGFLGKNHTPEICARISAAHLGKKRPQFTEETRMKISRATVRRMQNNPAWFSRKLMRGKVGRRADLGNRYFRSIWEANYARFMNYLNIKWEYETKTFWFEKIKRGTRSYTPDFYLPDSNEYHEVKGWMDPKSLTKLKRMAKYYPDVKIVIIGKEWFQAANKQGLCRLIPGWECNHRRHQNSPTS